MKLIHNVPEGGFCYQGINWRRDKASTFLCHVILWKLCATFRIRSEWIVNGEAPFNSRWHRWRSKYQLYFAWNSDPHFGIIKYSFTQQAFGIDDHWVTFEQLIDFIHKQGKRNADPFL